jgi:hypothetical protein
LEATTKATIGSYSHSKYQKIEWRRSGILATYPLTFQPISNTDLVEKIDVDGKDDCYD